MTDSGARAAGQAPASAAHAERQASGASAERGHQHDSHHFLLDLQATQSQAHADRGVARYVKDHTRALLRRGVGEALLLNPHLPFPRNLDHDLLGSPLLQWNTQSVVRRVAESVDGPIAFHLMSPFELSLRAEGDVPPHLFRGEVPVAVTLYDLIPLAMADRYLADARLAGRYRARAEQLHQVDLVLTISEHTRRDAIRLLDLDPVKVVTIGGGVSPSFRPERPGDAATVTIARYVPAVTKPFVYAVLGADPRKNTERLFRAWATTSVRRTHQLVVTCSLDAATRASWEAELVALGLTPEDVVLTGWIPEVVLRALYQRTALVVMPSLYEGFGLPVAEAVACGAPVITSNATSLPEILEWPEATFDPLDEPAIAALLTRGVEDQAFNAELRQRGRDRVPSLTWDAVAERTLAAYARLPQPEPHTELPMRLALVGPMPPAASGIADYNHRLLGPLAARAEVDVFTTAPRPDDLPAGVRWLPPRALQDTCSPWSYDAAVYTVGNSDHHHETYDLAQEFPGILWLHDVRIPGLYLTYAEARFPDDDGDGADERGEAFLRERLLRQYRRRLPLHLMYDDVRRTSGEFVEFGLGMAKELVDNARAVVVSSELARRLLALDQQPDGRVPPTHVVPHAALAPWGDASHRRAPDRPLLACFGIVAPVKGPELAIAALAALVADGVDAALALVGHVDDGYRDHLRNVAALAGVAERLTMTGRIERPEYERWLAEATVGLQLRLSTNGEMSGGIFDCLAAGLPTITNLPSSDELPAGVVDIVPWDVDGRALASHLQELLAAPERLAALAAAAQSFSATWGYAEVADRLIGIARSLPA